MVAPAFEACSANSTGPAFSVKSDDAPNRRGKTTKPPSPKVKAKGGEPAKTSSAVGCRM
ncbi:hypothetical protein D3C86_2255810 [compost metagenome]